MTAGAEPARTNVDPSCELCEAAPITDWFHEDEECWVAECESCSVPMVVWKQHDPAPPEDVRARLHAALATVVATHYDYEHVVDDVLRTIPTHYHAHARGRGGPWTVRRRRTP